MGMHTALISAKLYILHQFNTHKFPEVRIWYMG